VIHDHHVPKLVFLCRNASNIFFFVYNLVADQKNRNVPAGNVTTNAKWYATTRNDATTWNVTTNATWNESRYATNAKWNASTWNDASTWNVTTNATWNASTWNELRY
jgi:hypothetical protein